MRYNISKDMKKYSVSIVIPNWNGVYLMEKHLQGVLDAAPDAQIIIADDMSGDGSVEYIRKNFPHVIVVKGMKREGFAANVNQGVNKATGDVVILLNTDVEPEKGFLQPLLTHFDDPQVFAVGCLEKSWENGKTILRGRGVAHWYRGFYVHSRGEVDKTDTAWVSGGSGAFRRSMWNTLGGMDTLYNPFYWEDIDISYRARKAGWKILFEPKSVVGHYHEEGKIKQEYTATDVKRISYRNQFIFIWKNLTDPSILIAHMFWTPIRLLQTVLHGNILMLEGYLLALLRYPFICMNKKSQLKYWKISDRNL